MAHRFLLDSMLGSLARWLRILGYNTVYYVDLEDDELREKAKVSNRLLLTRDVNLHQNAKKCGLKTVLIKSENTLNQLKELVESLRINLVPLNTRCPRCNGDLDPIEKNEVEGKVPDESYKVFDKYWICSLCKSLYWKGSHWNQIEKTLNKIATSMSL